MFSSLEDLLFEFFNMYLRSSVLDTVLPLFESSLPVFLVAVVSLFVFAVYCKKTYGDMFYRFFLFFAMLGLSAVFAHEGSKFFAFERPRPYQEIAGTMYYNAKEDVWLQAQYAQSQGYYPHSQAVQDNEAVADADTEQENAVTGMLTEQTENSSETANSETGTLTNQSTHPLSVDLSKVKIIDGSAKLYPSSVLSISMAIAFVIALLMAKSSPYIYLFPAIIGWSQIYTGNAYLSDILVGWIVGILAVVGAWLCFAFFFRLTGRNS